MRNLNSERDGSGWLTSVILTCFTCPPFCAGILGLRDSILESTRFIPATPVQYRTPRVSRYQPPWNRVPVPRVRKHRRITSMKCKALNLDSCVCGPALAVALIAQNSATEEPAGLDTPAGR